MQLGSVSQLSGSRNAVWKMTMTRFVSTTTLPITPISIWTQFHLSPVTQVKMDLRWVTYETNLIYSPTQKTGVCSRLTLHSALIKEVAELKGAIAGCQILGEPLQSEQKKKQWALFNVTWNCDENKANKKYVPHCRSRACGARWAALCIQPPSWCFATVRPTNWLIGGCSRLVRSCSELDLEKEQGDF